MTPRLGGLKRAQGKSDDDLLLFKAALLQVRDLLL